MCEIFNRLQGSRTGLLLFIYALFYLSWLHWSKKLTNGSLVNCFRIDQFKMHWGWNLGKTNLGCEKELICPRHQFRTLLKVFGNQWCFAKSTLVKKSEFTGDDDDDDDNDDDDDDDDDDMRPWSSLMQ